MSYYYIYHHIDDDGWSSAAVVILRLLKDNKISSWNDDRLKLINYAYEPNEYFVPIQNFQKDDEVFVVDLSVSESTKDKFIAFLDILLILILAFSSSSTFSLISSLFSLSLS